MLILNRLSGFGASSAVPLAIALAGSAESTTRTITTPSGVQAGDLLLLLDCAQEHSGAPAKVVPTGFAEIASITGVNRRMTTSYKVADGSEALLTGQDGDTSDRKLLALIRGDTAIVSASGGGAVSNGLTNNKPSTITVAASATTSPVLVVGFYASSGAIDPRMMTPAKTEEVGNSGDTLYIAWKMFSASQSSVDIDMDDEGSANGIIGAYLQLAT